jgi:Predicted pPIWI-associating nuclease
MAKLKKNSARHLRPLMDRVKISAVMDAISQYDIVGSPSWSELEAISSHIQLDQIEAIPEGIFETDDGFSATASVYVLLNYGGKNDKLSSADTFPAQVDGHFENKESQIKAIIDFFIVDTSSFYE